MMRAPHLDPDETERAIVLQVLRDDHAAQWSRAELETELHDIEPLAINDALERLKASAVVHLDGEHVRASRCARHMDELGMVNV
jgi:hypothetical protein